MQFLEEIITQTAAEASQFNATGNLNETVRVDYTASMNFQRNVSDATTQTAAEALQLISFHRNHIEETAQTGAEASKFVNCSKKPTCKRQVIGRNCE